MKGLGMGHWIHTRDDGQAFVSDDPGSQDLIAPGTIGVLQDHICVARKKFTQVRAKEGLVSYAGQAREVWMGQ